MSDTPNQTQFSFEEPLFETPPTVMGENQGPSKPWYRKPIVWIIGGLGCFIFLLMLLSLLVRPPTPVMDDQEFLTNTPLPRSMTAEEQRLTQLKTELQAADPTKQDLPFPPVDMELELATP